MMASKVRDQEPLEPQTSPPSHVHASLQQQRVSNTHHIGHYSAVSLIWAKIPVYMLPLGWLCFVASRFFQPVFGSALLSSLITMLWLFGSIYLILIMWRLDVNTLPGGRTYLVNINIDTLRSITRGLGVLGNLLVFFGRGSMALSCSYLAVWWILAVLVLPPNLWMRWVKFVAQLGCVQLLLELQRSGLWIR